MDELKTLMGSETLARVAKDIAMERYRQDIKWGRDRDQDFYRWLAILGEEVGEANQALLEIEFGNKAAITLRKELIQVAAVAVAMVECIDRNQGVLLPGGNCGTLKPLNVNNRPF